MGSSYLGVSNCLGLSGCILTSAVGTAVKKSCRQGILKFTSAHAMNLFRSLLSIDPMGLLVHFQLSKLHLFPSECVEIALIRVKLGTRGLKIEKDRQNLLTYLLKSNRTM